MPFRKRVLVLPAWLLLASVPAGFVFYIAYSIVHAIREISEVTKVYGSLMTALLPFSFLMYVWLAAPFQFDRRKLLKWALLGVPLVALTWGAFWMALIFAVCGVAFK